MGNKTRKAWQEHRKDLRSFPGDTGDKAALQKMREIAKENGWQLKHLARKGMPDVWMDARNITLGGDVSEDIYADALPRIKAEGGAGMLVRLYGTDEQINRIAERIFEACPDYEFKLEAGLVEDLEPMPKSYVFHCTNRLGTEIAFGSSETPEVDLDPTEFDLSRLHVYEVPEGRTTQEMLDEIQGLIKSVTKTLS
jgi:hypothetical protein